VEPGNKSRTGSKTGMQKVEAVSAQINQVLQYIPYVQANFVFGLDSDAGAEPFELTKAFIDRVPGAFPASAMLTAYGDCAPLSKQYHQEGRVTFLPFQFLNSGYMSNVRPKNYAWPEFYDRMISLLDYSFSARTVYRRHKAVSGGVPRFTNMVRGLSAEGRGRARYLSRLRRRLDADLHFRQFLDGEETEPPPWMIDHIKRDLQTMWDSLPQQAYRYQLADVVLELLA
jgi:hypothetical protein